MENLAKTVSIGVKDLLTITHLDEVELYEQLRDSLKSALLDTKEGIWEIATETEVNVDDVSELGFNVKFTEKGAKCVSLFYKEIKALYAAIFNEDDDEEENNGDFSLLFPAITAAMVMIVKAEDRVDAMQKKEHDITDEDLEKVFGIWAKIWNSKAATQIGLPESLAKDDVIENITHNAYRDYFDKYKF